jgi:hypothetical protein
MASQVEKEKRRRVEAEAVYVRPEDRVAWRDATVADRPTVVATRIVKAALAVGWSVQEKYRETFAPPQWVAVEGQAHVLESRPIRVYHLFVSYAEALSTSSKWLEMGIEEGTLLAVDVLWLDGVAKRVRLGHAGKSTWTPGPSVASVPKLIREANK